METNQFLFEALESLGIDRCFIQDMNVTTAQLGMTSLDLFKLSAALFEHYGIQILFNKENAVSLNELTKEIQKLQEEKVV